MENRSRQQYLTDLRHRIVESFSQEELQTLCSDLGIEFDDLPGGGRVHKVRELIGHLERRGRTRELVAICTRLRPNIYWAAAPNTLLQKVIDDCRNAQNLVEESIEFVERLFPYVSRSASIGRLISIIDKLVSHINQLDDEGKKTSEDEILGVVVHLIEESNAMEALNEIEVDVSFPIKVSFADKEEALRALKKIAADQDKLVKRLLRRIHPDLALVTEAIGDTPELDKVMRKELTSRLNQLRRDESDILKLVVGVFEIIHKAGIPYEEIGISDQDVVEVAQAIEDYNYLEKQQDQIYRVLDEYGINVGDQKASIAKVQGYTKRSEQALSTRILELKFIIHHANCLGGTDRDALLKKIVELLERGLNMKVWK